MGKEQALPNRENQQIQLQGWVERGFDAHAIAAYGGSITVLNNILTTGTIPSYPIHEDYQRKITKEGEHFYFFTPIFNRIVTARPKLAENIDRRCKAKQESASEELSHTKVKLLSKGFALDDASKDYFMQRTGMSLGMDEIYGLAMDIIPQQFELIQKETTALYLMTLRSTLEFAARSRRSSDARNALSNNELKSILSECLKRRGVILYFNKDIFTDNKVYAGADKEGRENEFYVVSPQPLSSDTISGVEILSEADNKAALNP